jgi:hypothetical protein
MAGIEFEAPLELVDRGGAIVTIPPEVYEELGGSGRIPINATFDGISYRGSINRSIGGSAILGVLEAIRSDLGEGDVKSAFGRLSYTHQREYVQWIQEAKRPDTRQRRIAGTIERLTSS